MYFVFCVIWFWGICLSRASRIETIRLLLILPTFSYIAFWKLICINPSYQTVLIPDNMKTAFIPISAGSINSSSYKDKEEWYFLSLMSLRNPPSSFFLILCICRYYNSREIFTLGFSEIHWRFYFVCFFPVRDTQLCTNAPFM